MREQQGLDERLHQPVPAGDHGGRQHRGLQRAGHLRGRATTVPAGETIPTDEAVSGDAQEIIVNVDDPAQLGQTFEVALGQTVVLRLLSDTDQEYHVHGYDLEKQAAAGVEATFEFTADTAGSFEVESHTTDKVLATLQVT